MGHVDDIYWKKGLAYTISITVFIIKCTRMGVCTCIHLYIHLPENDTVGVPEYLLI